MIKSVKAFKAKWSGRNTIQLTISNPVRGEVFCIEVDLNKFTAKKTTKSVEVESTSEDEEISEISEVEADD